jgi:hypothetical protein
VCEVDVEVAFFVPVDVSVVVNGGHCEVFDCGECGEAAEAVDVAVVVEWDDVDADAEDGFAFFDAEGLEVDGSAFSEPSVDDAAWLDAFDAWSAAFELFVAH